jgi:transcriptional regulator with XRE-family HTH domain
MMNRQQTNFYIDIASFLERTGMTEEELAAMAGISQSHLNMIKNGHRTPTPEVAVRLAGITGVPLINLLLNREKKSRKSGKARSHQSRPR